MEAAGSLNKVSFQYNNYGVSQSWLNLTSVLLGQFCVASLWMAVVM